MRIAAGHAAPMPAKSGPDGNDVEADVADYLDFLRRLCGELGVPDPVEEYFAPVVGRWSDIHDEAARWRVAGASAEKVADSLTKPLGGLDAAWEGADAESFIDYMNKVGLAGHDMSDAMAAMSEVLDITADGLREIVTDMAGLLADVADTASQAHLMPVREDTRTRQYLDDMRRPTKELFEAVREVLEALVRLCDGVDGSQVFDKIAMKHTFPADNWKITTELPTVPAQVEPPKEEPKPADTLKGGGGGGGGGGSSAMGGGSGSSAPANPLGAGNFVTAGEAAPTPAGGLGASTPAAASAGDGGARSGSGGMMGGMPMGGMAGGQQGGETERKGRSRVTADPTDVFGKPTKASPSVIGED